MRLSAVAIQFALLKDVCQFTSNPLLANGIYQRDTVKGFWATGLTYLKIAVIKWDSYLKSGCLFFFKRKMTLRPCKFDACNYIKMKTKDPDQKRKKSARYFVRVYRNMVISPFAASKPASWSSLLLELHCHCCWGWYTRREILAWSSLPLTYFFYEWHCLSCRVENPSAWKNGLEGPPLKGRKKFILPGSHSLGPSAENDNQRDSVCQQRSWLRNWAEKYGVIWCWH